MSPPKIPLKERFWKHADMQPFGCWETDYTPSQVYGTLKVEGRWIKAHRVSYELAIGPIPDGLVVMHMCDNPRCVRPDHLDVGTPKDNSQDMSRKKRGRDQLKTHCIRGHSRWGRAKGRRYCMDCDVWHKRNIAEKKRLERILES